MFILANFILAVANILDIALFLYMVIVIGRAVLTWIKHDPDHVVIKFVHSVTEPVLAGIKKKLPLVYGGFDFSPLVVVLAIYFFQTFVIESLTQIAQGLK